MSQQLVLQKPLHRLILAPCATDWSAARRLVPRISLPAANRALGSLGNPFLSPRRPQKTDTWSSDERKTEEAYSFIIHQGIESGSLNLDS